LKLKSEKMRRAILIVLLSEKREEGFGRRIRKMEY
jgi:hypothetical protein